MFYNTVTPFLKKSLEILMKSKHFEPFLLVGGTALSLQLGHRMSVDIDLFTDSEYGTIDFNNIETELKKTFKIVDGGQNILPAFGKSFIIGESDENSVKLDVYYTDTFINPPIIKDNIRMATISEIAAMKIDVIQREGRKKDFWDLHELFSKISLKKMIELHEKRYPYSHNKSLIMENLINFKAADKDFDPICLKSKYWELIKEDIVDLALEI